MKLTKAIFWDTDYEKIDWDKSVRYVIGKVLNFGTQEDWKAINEYYGRNRIKQEAVQIRDLNPKAHFFASNVLDIPITDFKCYTSGQFTPKHWNY
ncbi:MAG: hypothetical protein R3D00_01115 [Bacteroidia bacterium]